MTDFIPLSAPNLKGNELRYVSEVIQAEWVSTAGAMITRFEQELAAYLQVDTAVACQNGTAGLHLAMLLAGVGHDDEVLVPALTFIAAVNPVRYAGAEPVFMDCDETLCLDADKLEQFCRDECVADGGALLNTRTRKRIKAVVVVHIFGNLANMARVMDIAPGTAWLSSRMPPRRWAVIISMAPSPRRFAGTIGDIGVYSFNGNKIITTGGGGMLVARDSALAQRAKYLSTQAKDDDVCFNHHDVGYNYRMTNLQAALGVAQLEQLEDFIAIKQQNYACYQRGISGLAGMRLLPFNANIRPNFWFYSLYLEDGAQSRDELMLYLTRQQIQTRPLWGLIHQQRPYLRNQAYRIEKAVDYQPHILNLPCSSNLTGDDLMRVVLCLRDFSENR